MSKKIIVCSDGTWNDPEQLDRGSLVPTNVVKLARALALAEQPDQKIFYDPGIGTGNLIDRWTGGLTGKGLIKNLFDCYGFIAQHYEPGDKIYLFGFSRGAYTVRSLSGLISRFGIDKSLSQQQLAKATTSAATGHVAETRTDEIPNELQSIQHQYEQYKREATAEKKDEVLNEFKNKTDCYEPEIEMIGVWDTVGSLGIPLPLPRFRYLTMFNAWLEGLVLGKYRFLNVQLNARVHGAYHALAIDENRKAFLPTLWKKDPIAPPEQILEQVWFAGIHSNVGGGYADAGLSDNALLWMVNRAQRHGLVFSEPYLSRRVNPDSFYGELRDERKKWTKKLLFTPCRRPIAQLCEEAGIRVVIAQSACKRVESAICKKVYRLPEGLGPAEFEPDF
ncbi:DUF2235 domain-containing protein [Spirosoma flavum]|uniref:DUF2235 domain-containing protein n=1 Tax=Spirosoma flavum TaxID=2048557 RepID=A0ABW6APQ3_9BACT